MISNEVLNAGLEMALEFGPNLNQPVNERIIGKFPPLTTKQAQEINQLCYQVRGEGHRFVYDTLENLANQRKTISNSDLKDQLKDLLLRKYLWINDKNLSSLFSQGCYYAMHDGLIEALTP